MYVFDEAYPCYPVVFINHPLAYLRLINSRGMFGNGRLPLSLAFERFRSQSILLMISGFFLFSSADNKNGHVFLIQHKIKK